jgi:regulator of sirC expression with transglutaminase-like and TPR domain
VQDEGAGQGADRTRRFAELLQGPDAAIHLDEAALLVAAHAYPGLDLSVWLDRLDALAAACRVPTRDGLLAYVFKDLGFAGNSDDYYDPRNSFLNDVLARRVGIPITLAIVVLELGRRVDVPLVGISMPGHFLLRDAADPQVFVDPFARGQLLDRDGCVAAFRAQQGTEMPFDEAYLEAADHRAIVSRLLANLRAIYRSRRDRRELEWVLRLRTAIPGTPVSERRELASVLAADGRFSDAAAELEATAATADDAAVATELRAAATRLRARLN